MLTAFPSPVQILGTGSTNAKTVTVEETDYLFTFSETNTCSAVATVSPTSAPSSGASGNPKYSAQFTVTGVAAGNCSVTFSDSLGQKKVVPVSVTTNPIIIEGTKW